MQKNVVLIIKLFHVMIIALFFLEKKAALSHAVHFKCLYSVYDYWVLYTM